MQEMYAITWEMIFLVQQTFWVDESIKYPLGLYNYTLDGLVKSYRVL